MVYRRYLYRRTRGSMEQCAHDKFQDIEAADNPGKMPQDELLGRSKNE